MKNLKQLFFVASSLLCCAAHATVIDYSVQNLGGTSYQYTYSVTNDTLGTNINELTFYFDPSLFDQIAVGASQPSAWSQPVAAQPDIGLLPDLSAYGFFDTIATDSGIAVGDTLGGFTAVVNYLGNGTPGSQIFQVVDANTFATLEQGTTVLSLINNFQDPVDVPEPQTWFLLLTGLLLAVVNRHKNKGAK